MTAEAIITALAELPECDQRHVAYMASPEAPSWSRLPVLFECDGECGTVVALNEEIVEAEKVASSAEANLDEADRAIDKLRALLDEHDIDHSHIDY